MRSMRSLPLLVLLSCATASHSIDSRAECDSQCGSYGYPILRYEFGRCECETRQCARPKHRGGCEQLAPATAPLSPSVQM